MVIAIDKRCIIVYVKKVAKKRATLNVSQEAKSELNTVKSPGQSYDGIIRELVKFWSEKHKEYWTRRRRERS